MHKVLTKCLHSMHNLCICFFKLITVCFTCARCRLCRLGGDFADLVQQNPCSTHFGAPSVPTDCAQTLQNLRPCPKPPGSKRQLSQTPVSARHGAAKMQVSKKYPCLTRFGAPGVPTTCLRMRPNSADLETMPDTDGFQSLGPVRLL